MKRLTTIFLIPTFFAVPAYAGELCREEAEAMGYIGATEMLAPCKPQKNATSEEAQSKRTARKSTYTGALRLLVIGGMLLAIGGNSFARSMSNPCGTRGKDNYMAYDYCMGNSSNPVTDQIPERAPDWPGERPEKPNRCAVQIKACKGNPGCVELVRSRCD